MKQTMKAAASYRSLAVLVVAAGFAVGGCAANNAGNAPGAGSPAPAPPAVSLPHAQPQLATVNWARSMCQALSPAFSQLGTPPQPDLNNAAATRQAYSSYLTNARNATQQAIDRLASVGAPPLDNGQQVFDQIRTKLTQLRDNLGEASTQLRDANPNDSAAIGRAFSATTDLVGLIGTLSSDPQLRAAVSETPECQNLTGTATTSTTQPPGSPQPTR